MLGCIISKNNKPIALFSSKQLAKGYLKHKSVQFFNKIISPQETMPFGMIVDSDLKWNGTTYSVRVSSGLYISDLKIMDVLPLNPRIKSYAKN